MIPVVPMHPIPMKFDHAVHVVTFKVQVKTSLFFLRIFLPKNIISLVALCAPWVVVGTLYYRYFLIILQ